MLKTTRDIMTIQTALNNFFVLALFISFASMITKTKKNQKEDFQSAFFGALILLLVFGTAGFLIFSNVRLKQKREDLNLKLESLKQELQDLEKQNEELKSGIDKIDTESFQKEKLYEQGYVEEGANQVVVLPQEDSQKEREPEQKNFWQKLLENFEFGK